MASLAPDKFVPTSNSTAQDWISWRTALGHFYGRKKANQIFTIAWSKRGGVNVKGNTTELREYLKGVGLSVETNGLQEIQDYAGDVAESIGDIFTIGKWTTIAVIVVGVGGLGMLIYAIAKKPERIILATPAGRAGAATGLVKV